MSQLQNDHQPRHAKPTPVTQAIAIKRGPQVPFGGFLMALADSVPGVSGGTVAFILGIYDSLLASLDRLVSGTSAERKAAVAFLVKLFCGWGCGFVAAVLVLTRLFESHIYVVSSVFLGFIVFSIPLIVRQERANLRWGISSVLWVLLGAGAVVAITLANTTGGTTIAEQPALDLSSLSLGSGLYVFFAAMVAISAMILPGISGSTFLLIFGLYLPVMSGIRACLGGDFSTVPALALFALGCVCGLLTVVKLVKRALERHRNETVHVLIGLMVGSVYAIVCGPTTLDEPLPMMTLATFNVVAFLVGGLAILGLEVLRRKLEA